MQLQGEERNWERWKQLKVGLEEAYKAEKDLWRKKSRISWLKEGDSNTKFFHATIVGRRNRNII